MTNRRLEAFSEGVIAIIITIMVLDMKVPRGDRLDDLVPLVPTFLSYVLSFVYVGIYWNNHHYMLHACTTSFDGGKTREMNLHAIDAGAYDRSRTGCWFKSLCMGHAMTSTSSAKVKDFAGEPIPPRCAVIEVHVGELKQLFDAIDLSPLRDRDLDPKAEEFIAAWAKDLARDASLALVVDLDRQAGLPDEAAVLTLLDYVRG